MTFAVGDLVLCIRPPACCKCPGPLGGPYEVLAVRGGGDDVGYPGVCVWCKRASTSRSPEARIEVRGGAGWVEFYRLKKIWPLPLKERLALVVGEAKKKLQAVE